MNDPKINIDHLLDLADAVCDETVSRDELSELDSILNAEKASRRYYCDYCRMHILLEIDLQSHDAVRTAFDKENVDLARLAPWESEALMSTASPVQPSGLPLAFPRLSPVHGLVGYLSSGWPMAYLIATVILGIGLAVGTIVHVSHRVQFTRSSSPPNERRSESVAGMRCVGRVTRMANCRWADIDTLAVQGSRVPLGRRYDLASGMMEITYDTGAKVMLEGPVHYEVESPAGGYLSVGKLTAKVEKKSEVGGQRSESANQKSSDLFAIRTPTAIVTDLGTEFGVEVDREGRTFSHVFRGLVRLQPASSDGTPQGNARMLQANESARIDRGDRVTIVAQADRPIEFVREIPKSTPTVTSLDLVDVVAGGNGFLGRRNRGIDPTNGQTIDMPSEKPRLLDDGKYHRVKALPMIDGVFVPDGRKGPVQVDSAGHTFDAFPATAYETNGHVWAGGILPLNDPAQPNLRAIPTKLAGVECSASGHGLIFLHANKGITFDLDAVRTANPGHKPVRFCAVAGNTGAATVEGKSTYADLWVLVDGRSRWQRRQINGSHGAFSIVIPLDRNDRFLTLVATDGGDNILADWTMFGDLQIELSSPPGESGVNTSSE
jgi:hypothetical protein